MSEEESTSVGGETSKRIRGKSLQAINCLGENAQAVGPRDNIQPGCVSKIAVFLATAGGLGYLPKAPGTFGSLPGLAVGAAFYEAARGFAASLNLDGASVPSMLSAFSVADLTLIVTAVSTITALKVLAVIAYWSIDRTEKLWQIHDDKRIVSDEVVGQAIAVAFVPPTMFNLAVGFALFRLFDIWKPSLIGWADQKVDGALGTLLDDVFAGLVALCLVGFLQ